VLCDLEVNPTICPTCTTAVEKRFQNRLQTVLKLSSRKFCLTGGSREWCGNMMWVKVMRF
jgi:hypothetical protein